MLRRFLRQAIQHSARPFICREETFDAQFLQSHIPVSYTHLDVYKRQIQSSSQHWSRK